MGDSYRICAGGGRIHRGGKGDGIALGSCKSASMLTGAEPVRSYPESVRVRVKSALIHAHSEIFKLSLNFPESFLKTHFHT